MLNIMNIYALLKTFLLNPQMIKVKPSINRFLYKYLNKFKIQNINGKYIIHSHLPPINSKAYTKFVNQHLLIKNAGLSHAQIGLTNACPQNCEYCYNKDKTGKVMDIITIKKIIQDLKKMGIFWLGFTGGEPLLNKDIVQITESVGDECALKLFTTGCNLTKQLASDLKNAGLLYVSVSLDHWIMEEHDKIRRYPGAFKIALKAIEIFKNLDSMQVSVSAVLSRKMIRENMVDKFLEFLIKLGVHEAWLSEVKPSVESLWNRESIITKDEQLKLIQLQDEYNKKGKITVNYLGHFEAKEHYGCTAGHKMIYIDSFGNVSPCVFTPFTFGNVMERPMSDIYDEMRKYFPTENRCFINSNYEIIHKYYKGKTPIDTFETYKMMKEIEFGPMAEFFQLQYK